jgi:hypothetical protein
MKLLYKAMNPRVFLYNATAHTTLAILFAYVHRGNILRIIKEYGAWDAEYGRVAYVLGHLLIASTQYLLSFQNPGEAVKVSILGSCSHSLLLIYVSWLMTHFAVTWATTAFVIGQLGMIYFYQYHTQEEKVMFDIRGHKIRNKDLFVAVFSILLGYYIYGTTKESQLHKYGLGAVAGVYLSLIIHYSYMTE